jgi:hypothetical protein
MSQMISMAVSVWEVIPAVASLLAALALTIGVVQITRLQHVRADLERHALHLRVEKEAVERTRTLQQLEIEGLLAELVHQQLLVYAAAWEGFETAERGERATLRGAAHGRTTRRLEFLARKRIESVAVADRHGASSPDDLSFAAGAAELLGREIAARGDGE